MRSASLLLVRTAASSLGPGGTRSALSQTDTPPRAKSSGGGATVAAKQPTSDELPALLTNVSFEVEVLAWSLHRADQLHDDAEVALSYLVATDRSAYVNAALVAGRNLFCFFANDRWSKGAPITRDFMSTWEEMPGGPALGVANQQVAHIGLGRVRNPATRGPHGLSQRRR
jgi:hypothetical protein